MRTYERPLQITRLDNQTLVCDQAKSNYEKLKGRFCLQINHNLDMGKKIEIYANEQIAFHLHKNRNFIDKLTRDKELKKKVAKEK